MRWAPLRRAITLRVSTLWTASSSAHRSPPTNSFSSNSQKWPLKSPSVCRSVHTQTVRKCVADPCLCVGGVCAGVFASESSEGRRAGAPGHDFADQTQQLSEESGHCTQSTRHARRYAPAPVPLASPLPLIASCDLGNGIVDEFHVIRHLTNLETVNTYEGTGTRVGCFAALVSPLSRHSLLCSRCACADFGPCHHRHFGFRAQVGLCGRQIVVTFPFFLLLSSCTPGLFSSPPCTAKKKESCRSTMRRD